MKRIILLSILMLAGWGVIKAQTIITGEAGDIVPFFIEGPNREELLTCDKVKRDGLYTVGASECHLKDGVSIDRIVSVMLEDLAQTQKSRNEMEDQYLHTLHKYVVLLRGINDALGTGTARKGKQ